MPTPSTSPTSSWTPPGNTDTTFDAGSVHDWVDWFVGVPLQILLIIVIGSITLVLLRRIIRQTTDRIAEGTPILERRRWRSIGKSQVGGVLLRANPLATARRAQRARTVGSVLRSTTNIVVVMIIVLMVLDQIGVNITPFLASAGIAGVALGFGAQSLVKDFLSGTFMLLEDQYGVGDVVDFGEITGTVEEVALRVTKVRDVSGTLWYIRNGEILRTGNKTQEWGRALVEVRVPYATSLDDARIALGRAAQQIAGDPELSEHLLDEPEILGPESMSAESLLLKVQVRTHAAQQWEISRALRAAIRDQLSAAGVPFAGAQQVIVLDHTPGQPPSDAEGPGGFAATRGPVRPTIGEEGSADRDAER